MYYLHYAAVCTELQNPSLNRDDFRLLELKIRTPLTPVVGNVYTKFFCAFLLLC